MTSVGSAAARFVAGLFVAGRFLFVRGLMRSP
jgi:hypothetical protein